MANLRWLRATQSAHLVSNLGGKEMKYVCGGGGFFLACEDFLENSFPACAFFSPWKLAPHTNSTLYARLIHSGSASWDDCGWVFPDELRVSSFPDTFPHYAWTAAQSAHSDFVGLRVYACLGVTCHLHFGQNGRGLLRASAELTLYAEARRVSVW